jgi:DNA repair photolyase
MDYRHKFIGGARYPDRCVGSPDDPGAQRYGIGKNLETTSKAGAFGASYIMLRLPLEISGLFKEWLERHYPDRTDHMLSLLRQTHGGAM